MTTLAEKYVMDPLGTMCLIERYTPPDEEMRELVKHMHQRIRDLHQELYELNRELYYGV